MRFTQNQIELALRLKGAGLVWTPGVGQYAYDREQRIRPGSPFQDHVYFFLDFPCFIEYFGGLDALQASMAWLPTWEQTTTLLLCHDGEFAGDILSTARLSAGTELDAAYEALLGQLAGFHNPLNR